MPARRVAVIVVWLLALAGVVLAVALVPGAAAYAWLALVLALSVVLAMVAQVLVAEQRGFVVRAASASVGAFLLVAAGAFVVLLR